MNLVARLLTACLLAAFLVGTVTQVASFGLMSMDMSGAAHAEIEASSCAGCDGDGLDGQSDCGGACVAAHAAALPVEWAEPLTGRTGVIAYPEGAFRNRVEPPAQTPPRTVS